MRNSFRISQDVVISGRVYRARVRLLGDENQLAQTPLGVQVRIAVMLYNRLGAEGEKSRAEGDITREFELLPHDIRAELLSHRLAKTGGV